MYYDLPIEQTNESETFWKRYCHVLKLHGIEVEVNQDLPAEKSNHDIEVVDETNGNQTENDHE